MTTSCSPTCSRPLVLVWLTTLLFPPVHAAQAPDETPPPGAQTSIACAPRLSTSRPDTSLTIVGSQEGEAKQYYGPTDVLVIDGGPAQGVDVGQEYFVRRVVSLGGLGADTPLVLQTAGWVEILDAERDAALARVVRACSGFELGDFLEVVEWPATSPIAPPGQPDYESAGVILFGLDSRSLIATRDHFVLNRGFIHGFAPGQRLTVFRRTLGGQRAITELGEAVAVVVDAESTTAQLTRIRDAVEVGDLIAPQR